MKQFFVITHLFITLSLILSCSSESSVINKQFKSLLSGDYKPVIKPAWKRMEAPEFAEFCEKLEKKYGKVPNASGTVHVGSTGSIYMTCGGFVDKCNYKILWWWYQNPNSEGKLVEEQIVDLCKIKERRERLKKQGYIEIDLN